jgi:hypothetical protein
MPDLTLESRVARAEDAVFRELDGEAVILHLQTGMYYGLDPVATRLWQLIDEHERLQGVYDAALQEFDVQPDVLQRDLLHLVRDLAERQLVVISG